MRYLALAALLPACSAAPAPATIVYEQIVEPGPSAASSASSSSSGAAAVSSSAGTGGSVPDGGTGGTGGAIWISPPTTASTSSSSSSGGGPKPVVCLAEGMAYVGCNGQSQSWEISWPGGFCYADDPGHAAAPCPPGTDCMVLLSGTTTDLPGRCE